MNITKWLAMLVVMLALTGFVVAEANDTADIENETHAIQGQALNVRYDHLQCKVEFTNTQIDLFKQYVPEVDQSVNKDKLLSDMVSLKVYLDNADKDGFDAYVSETLSADMKNATADLNVAKKNFRQYNLTNETRTLLIADLKDAKEVYSECVDDKEVKMAKVMETHMENWNRQWNHIADKMSEKNITLEDVQALQAEIAAKNEQLTNLIAEGNITKIRDFMKAYHELELSYAARFEVARLKGYRDKFEPIANKYGMSGKIDDIDRKIANAQKYINEQKHNDSEFRNAWKDIQGAGKDMQNAAKEINAERVKERQQNMDEKKASMQDRIQERDKIRNRSQDNDSIQGPNNSNDQESEELNSNNDNSNGRGQ